MSLDENQHYPLALGDICDAYLAFRPPQNKSVSQSAIQHMVLASPGQTSMPWSPTDTPYMVEPMDMLSSRRHESVVFVGPARTGKCLDLDTPIPTPRGWVRMGDLQAGSSVFGSDGRPTRVLAAHGVQHNLQCYQVEFSDGTTLVADAEHLWGVERFFQHQPQWRAQVTTTAEMLRDYRTGARRKYRIRNTHPLDFPQADLPIEPYAFGLWLANGAKDRATVTCHSQDVSVYIQAFIDAGHRCDVSPVAGKKAYRITVDPGVRGVKSDEGSFSGRLRKAGVYGEKRVPQQYLRASVAQRQALLQGLMDGDGHAPGGSKVVVGFVDKDLFDSVLELIRSLGYAPTVSRYQTPRGYTWRAIFRALGGEPLPFRLTRKAARISAEGTRSPEMRYVENIVPVASRPVRCIQVDAPDSLFLAGEGMVPTHNTVSLVLGWVVHAAVNDPGDFLITQMTQDKAREFSKVDLSRVIDNSPDVRQMLSAAASDRNTHDIQFRHGMWLRIGWPTVANLSSSTYRYTAVTDYDRIKNRENVDGEGNLFGLMAKRTTTFLSRGMALAESSPGEPLTDPSWKPTQQHEAPPIEGILGLYNLSDRRRWYWRCPDCRDRFEAEPGLGLFHLPDDNDLLDEIKTTNIGSFARQYARVICPACGSVIDFKHRHELNKSGRWLAAGQHFEDDRPAGDALQTTSAGYWLGGVAAAYQKWESLIVNHLNGLKAYDLNGSEEKLKQTVNTDQGMPYLPRYLVEAGAGRKTPQELAEDLPRHVVPDQTRCVTATVDVQGGVNARFIVQVHAIGAQREKWLVDRYEIKESKREGMGAAFAPLDPASHPEDWDVLTDRVVLSTYRTSVPGREIRVHRTMVDTGGEDGVTHNAYAWFRRLRAVKLAGRVALYKGASAPNAPILRQTLVGARSKNDKPDIPLYQCNPNLLSDAVDAGLRRQQPGPGYVHFPKPKHEATNPRGWLTQAFFDELTAEVRLPNGTWQQVKKRNETFDLLRMNHALELQMGLDKVQDWGKVPAWLAPLDQNSDTITTEERREMKATNETVLPADTPLVVHRPVVTHRRARRAAASPYLR